ncbi:DNA-processing protein DprA [Aeromicrobium chenweiae]|uniref:DNA-protecting protein DprA n=1 Tax=Aeromicrobium chenweiae TaxID=2079793 RepID=A0A2S0WN74_9ACTN|nr:DNA-processing protein DprA [Aeromicrobium chenweiae]AWB92799.1 DNA-protecting protein DprA [Aeromicrobium chenweiae]TGN33793.1 DNA-protecting protein DprA [Aeromicrobium chenweiae]
MSREARLALSLVVEPGDARLRDLLQVHDPDRVLRAVRREGRLAGERLPEAWVERAGDVDDRVDRALSRAEAAGLRWLCPGDADWPSSLDDLDHVNALHGTAGAPIGLWVRGTASLRSIGEEAVAVVGARDCTTYGAEVASDLGADLADARWTVVSGAAYGIDGCAHRGALAMGRPTVAVLACGADVDYPRSHASLLSRIAEDGLVVSEQAPGEAPLKGRFLSRNRIIAALGQGTVVVEAAVRSGSLNTLNWADQLGRATMALPGPVTSKASGGVHAAVREGKAVLVTSGADVLEELGGLGAEESALAAPSTQLDLLPPAARTTLDGLDWHSTRSLAEVAAGVRLSLREVRSALELLERRALVVRHADGWVLRPRPDAQVRSP